MIQEAFASVMVAMRFCDRSKSSTRPTSPSGSRTSVTCAVATPFSVSISTRTVVPLIPMVAAGVVTSMPPVLATWPAMKTKPALYEVEAAEVVLPGGVVDQFVHHHPARCRQGEDRPIHEGDGQPALRPGLEHVVEEDLRPGPQRLHRAVGALDRGVAGQAFHLADRVALRAGADLRILPGASGPASRATVAAEHRAFGREEVRGRAPSK
jgi:hypothetical protein